MIYLLDLGINNLASLVNGFSRLGSAEVLVTSEPVATGPGDLIVLPGTGSFASGMERLRRFGLDSFLMREASIGTRIVGICLGMHLLGTGSDESRDVSGLSIIPAYATMLLSNAATQTRVPHVGWSTIVRESDGDFSDFDFVDGQDVYFSHSYVMHLEEEETFERLLTSFDGKQILSGFRRSNILGFQFHPEKSSATGMSILASSTRWAHAQV